ncbi:hypothetical protein TGDOM2_242780A, partial [Toxoplasma gondii GAB2-2007-GAL-DOM2]
MAPAGASSSPPPGGGRETAPLASSLSPAEQLVFDVKAAAAWTLLHEEFICHLRRFSDDLRALHSKGLAVASEVSSVSAGSTKPEGVGTALSRSLTSFLSLCLAEANQADRLATRLKAEATTPVEAVLEKTQSPQAEQENEDANTPRAAGQTPTGSGVQTAGVAGEVAATAEVQKAAKKLQLAHEELKVPVLVRVCIRLCLGRGRVVSLFRAFQNSLFSACKSEDSLKELVSLFGSSVAPRLLQKAEERVDRAKRLHATAEADYRSVVNANARPEVTGREETPKARLLAPQKRQDPCSWLVSLVHARPSDALGGFVVAANAGEKRAIVFSSSLGTACVLALRASATCLLDSTRESILGRLPFVKKTDEASRETVIVANLKNLPAEVSRPLLSTEVENCMRRCVDLSLLEDGKPNGTLETTDEAGILTLKNLLKQREKELESEKEQRRALQRERDALEETAHALRIREASRANESEHLKKEVDRLRGLLAASSHRGLGGKTVREEGAFLEDEKRRKLELEPCATRDEMATQGGGRGELWSTVDEELDSESRERGEILPFSRSQSRHPHLPEDSTLPCFSSTSGRGRGTESDATSPVLPTSSGARTNARPAATGARKEDGQLSGEASMPREALDAQLGWLRNQLMYEAYLVSLRRLPLPLLLYHLSPVGARAARRPASAVGDTGRLAPANCLQRSETPGSPPRPSAGSTSPPALSLPARRHPASGGSAAFFCSAVAPTQGDAEPSFSLSWESRRFPNFLVSLVEGLAAAALPRALYECCRVAAVSVLGEERRGALAFGGRDGFAREVSHRMSLLQVQRDREKRQRRERVAKDSTEFSEEDLQMLAYELLLLCAHLHSQYAAFAALVAEADAEGVREGSEESPNEAQKKTETQSASVRHSGEAVAEKASREREREAEVDALLDKTGAAAPSRRRRTLLARRLSAKRQERRAPERPEEEMTGKEAEDASKSEKSRRGTTRKSGGLLFFSRGASGLLTRPTAPGTEREAQAMAAERVGGDCSRDEARLGEKAGGCSPSPRSPRRLAQEDQRKREDPASDGLAPFGVSVEAWLRRTGVVPEARDGSAASWREEGLSRGKRTATLSRWIAPDPPLLHANLKLLRQLLVLSRIAFQIPSSSSNILLRLLVPAADCLWAAGSRNCLHPCDLRFRVARLTEAWQMAAAPASAASLVSPKDIARRPLRKPETSVTFVHPKKRRDQLLRFGGKKLKEEESQPVSDTRHVSFLSPGARQTNRDSCSVTSLSSARSGEQAGARESEKEKTDEKKEKKEKKPGLKSALKRFNAQTTKNALSVMVGPQGHLLWGAQEKKSRGVTETNPATRGLSCPHDLPPVQGGFTLWGDKKSEEGEKDARRQSGDHSSLGGVCESKNGSCRDGKPTTFLKRFSPSCLAFDPVYKAFVKRQLQLLHMATLLRFTRFFRFFFGEALSRRVADLAPELLPAHHRDSKSSEVAFPSLSASPAPGASFEAGGGPLGSARRATPLHPPVSGTFFSSLAQSLRQRTRPARFGPRGPEPGEELHGDNETAFFSEPFFSSYRAPPPFSALYTRTEGSDERAALLYFILCLLCHEAAPEAPFWAYGGDGVVSAETEGPAACPRPPARLLFALEDLADATAAAASLDLLPLRQLAAFYHIFLYLFELDRLLSLANAAGASPCGSWGDPTVDVELLEVEVQVLSERTRAELKSEARQRRQEREARGDWHTEETPEEDETIWELRCTHRTRSGSEMLQRLLFMMTACADLDSAIRIALARRWEAKQRQDTGRPGQGDARGDGESADHEKKLFLEVPRRPGGEMSDEKIVFRRTFRLGCSSCARMAAPKPLRFSQELRPLCFLRVFSLFFLVLTSFSRCPRCLYLLHVSASLSCTSASFCSDSECSAMFLSDVEREAAASGSGAAAKSRLRAPSRFFRRSRSSRALSVAGHLGLSGDSEGEGVSVSGGRETRDVARADDGRPPLPQVRLARSQSRRLGSRRRKQTGEDRGEVDPTREENSHILGLPREQLLAAFWAMDVPLLLSLLLLLSKCCLDSRNASGLHVDAPVLAQGLVLVSQAAQLGVDPTAVSTREETWRHRRRETGAAETKGGANGPLPAELSRCFNLKKAARAGAGLLPLSLQSPALLLAACVWRNAATASSLANVDLFYEETGDRRRRADGAEATAESLEAFHASASPCMQDLNLHASPCPSRLSSHASTVSPGAALEPQPGAAGQAGSAAAVEPQGERDTVSAEGVSVQKKTDSPALGRVGSLGLPESRQAELLGELRVGASVGPDGKALAPTGAASDEAFAPIGPEVVEAVAEILCAFPTFLKKPFAESAEAEPPALVLAAAAAGIRSGAATPVPSPALDLNASERPEADAEGAGRGPERGETLRGAEEGDGSSGEKKDIRDRGGKTPRRGLSRRSLFGGSGGSSSLSGLRAPPEEAAQKGLESPRAPPPSPSPEDPQKVSRSRSVLLLARNRRKSAAPHTGGAQGAGSRAGPEPRTPRAQGALAGGATRQEEPAAEDWALHRKRALRLVEETPLRWFAVVYEAPERVQAESRFVAQLAGRAAEDEGCAGEAARLCFFDEPVERRNFMHELKNAGWFGGDWWTVSETRLRQWGHRDSAWSQALRRSASSRQFFFLSPALPSRVELQQEEAAASQLLTLFFLLLLQNQLQDYRRFFEPASLAHALGLWRSLVRLLLQLVQQRSLSAPSEAVTDPACPACPTSFTGTVIPGGLRAPAGVPAGASVEAEEARRALAPGVCGRTFWAGSAGGGPFFEQCETQAVLLDWRHLEEGDLALWQASVEQRFAALLQISRERGKSFIARGERCSHDEATGGRTSFRESSRRRDREGRERERDEGDPSVNPTSGSGDARHSRLLPFFSPSPGLRSRFALPFFSPGGLGRRATGEAGSSFLDCSEELHCDDENMLRLSLALSGPSILEDSLRCFIYQSLTSAAGREFRGAFVALEADREAQREGRGYSERTRQWKRTTDSPVPADLLRLCEQEQDALLDQVVASLRGFLSHVREELLLYSPVFAPHLPLRNEFSFLILSAARLLVAALLAEVFRTAVWAGTGGEVELLPAKGGAELLEVLGEFEKLCKEVTLSRVSALQPLAIPPLLPPMAPAFLSSVSVRLDAVSSMLRSFLERDSLVPVDPPHSSYSEKAADCWHVVCNLAAAVLETPAPISWILPPFLKFLHSFFVAFSSFCALSPSEAEEGTSAALLLPLLALEQRQLKNFLSLLSAEGRKALKVDAALQSAAMLALAQMSDAEGSKKKRAALT